MPQLTRRVALLATPAAAWLGHAQAQTPAAQTPAAQTPAPGTSGDMPFIDAFGPTGTADDTATFNAALRSGQPFRLRGRDYIVAGPVAKRGAAVVMHGVPGASRIVCKGLDTGAWFRLDTKLTIDIDGIIWDGNGAKTGSDAGFVTIAGEPATCALRRCGVLRGGNPAGLLISVAAAAPDHPLMRLDEIVAAGNSGAGIWVEHGVNLLLSALRLHDNKGVGLQCRRYGNRAGAPIRRIVVRDSFAWKNGNAGFSVGSYNEAPGGAPEILGPNLADTIDVTLANLFAWDNKGYGIHAAGHNVRVIGCRTTRNGENGGIDSNARNCVIQDCEVTDERGFGIDTGGSYEVEISRNRVTTIDGAGINPGGSQFVTGTGNRITGCTGPAIAIWNTEFGGGGWFQYQMNHCRFENTTIDMSRMGDLFAIAIRDGARDIVLDGVDIISTPGEGRPGRGAERALLAVTATLRIARTRFNGSARLPATPSNGVLTIPDIAEAIVLPATAQTLTRIQTVTAARVGTGIGWIEVTDPGSGYDPARSTATLEGDGNIAAVGKLNPNIWTGGGGQLVGFRLPAPGTGFTRASVAMAGPGAGARMTVHIGVPLPPERRLTVYFPAGGRLAAPLPPATIPPGGLVELHEFDGAWRIASRG